ncbi:hypothetical protein HanPSC8_Chr13g0545261 [Helianthus annuus]|nr:hypothetical protein HanPSC8_Chr13g0545261 [Helianthus annuus]
MLYVCCLCCCRMNVSNERGVKVENKGWFYKSLSTKLPLVFGVITICLTALRVCLLFCFRFSFFYISF